MTNQQIKKLLKDLIIKEKRKVTAHWNCGYDDAILWFKVDGEEYEDQFEDLFYELGGTVIDKLNLPSASMHSEKGMGTLDFYDNFSLYIKFDNNRIEYPVDDTVDINGEKVDLGSLPHQSISIQETFKLPFSIRANKKKPHQLRFYSTENDGIKCSSHSELSDLQTEYLERAFFKYEEQRLFEKLATHNDDFIAELMYQCEVYANQFKIKMLEISYEQITKCWKGKQIVLIP